LPSTELRIEQGKVFLLKLKLALDTEPSTDNAMFYEAIKVINGLIDFIENNGGEAAEALKAFIEETD